MLSTCWLALALCVGGQDDGSPLGLGLVRSIELSPAPGTCVQHFRLDREKAREGELPVALLRYVAGPDGEGGVRAGLEIEYLDGHLHVIHTEQANLERRRLVFREVGERAGRTVFLEGSPEQGYSGYELGGPTVVRRSFPADCGAGELPLLLLESVRLGFALPENLAVFDPLGARFEDVELALRANAEGQMAGERTHEARRADGSLRWRVTLQAQEIRAWRFQERGPLASAIPAEEFARLREQHDQARRAVREAAARPSLRPPSPRPQVR
ncbi:MAG: hypothetical protein EXS08_15515 [Planctomycetes bacterium]|nr:hypothetical protein [Planctomycetota bacterium]